MRTLADIQVSNCRCMHGKKKIEENASKTKPTGIQSNCTCRHT